MLMQWIIIIPLHIDVVFVITVDPRPITFRIFKKLYIKRSLTNNLKALHGHLKKFNWHSEGITWLFKEV